MSSEGTSPSSFGVPGCQMMRSEADLRFQISGRSGASSRSRIVDAVRQVHEGSAIFPTSARFRRMGHRWRCTAGKYPDRRPRRRALGHVHLSFGQSTHDAAQDRQCIHRAVVLAFFEVRAALGHRVSHMGQAEDLAASRHGEGV